MMKKWFLWGFLCPLCVQAQEVQLLQEGKVQELFPFKVQKKLGISFPITKVYTYQDEEGKHFWVFSENKLYDSSKKGEKVYRKNNEGEVINDKIKAFHLLRQENTFQVVKILYDYRPKWEGWEFSIGFWTKFSSLTDLDKDGYVDPIIVYGATPTDGDPDRGKVKIITYYKGEKVGIRHQDAPDDSGRETQIDAAYYKLPKPIRQRIFDTINRLQEQQLTLFNPEDFRKLKR